MAKFIAHSPNGQAYQCDSIAEVKQVEGGFKFRKTKKRNGGCGCAGACGNPHCGPKKRRNPTKTGIEYSWERIERLDPRVALQEARNALTTLSQSRRQGEAMRDFLKRDTYARERFNAALAYLQRRGVVSKFEAERYMSQNPLNQPSAGDRAVVRAAINEQESKLSRGYSGDIKRDYYESCWKSYLKGGMTKAQVYEAIGYKSRNPDPRYVPAVLNPKKRNGMSKSHLAHEKEEEKIFASMLSRLPIGKTVQAGSHRVRKLSKGYAVIDGERLSMKDAAAKLHGR